jgi:hypothetical protein
LFVCLLYTTIGVTRESDTPGKGGPQKCNGNGRKTAAYLVKELNGWIYLFPDAARPGAIEQYSDPFIIPEAISPNFRYVEVCYYLTFYDMDISFFTLVLAMRYVLIMHASNMMLTLCNVLYAHEYTQYLTLLLLLLYTPTHIQYNTILITTL